MNTFDSIIIGGGPAGLSAAIYLGRFLRKVLVLDKGHARSTYPQVNYNYLGFPHGIAALQLRERVKDQALQYGVVFLKMEIINVLKEENLFYVKTNNEIFYGKTIIIATGVTDNFPLCSDIDKCVGISLYWCITCDGYKTQGKTVVIVGNTDEAAETAMQLLNYTNKIIFVTNAKKANIHLGEKWQNRLIEKNITLHDSQIESIQEEDGMIKKIVLDNGTILSLDLMFSLQGAQPNVKLAQQLEVNTNEKGYIKVDTQQRTNIPKIYAAGDVTNMFSQQIVTAAHEGSMAAQSANYDLYDTNQKE